MNGFPISLNLENRNILIIGSGNIAKKRVNKLLDYTNSITVISKHIDEKSQEFFKNNNIKQINKEFEQKDLDGFDIVIAAIDDIDLQKEIYTLCREKRVLYNCVDVQECCDFIFPSSFKEGDLTFAITTNGVSPSFSKEFKNYIKSKIPDDISSFLIQMKQLRTSLPKGNDRMNLMKDKVKEYMKKFD